MPEIVAAHLERVARELAHRCAIQIMGTDDYESEESLTPLTNLLAAALAACAREATETAIQAFGGCLCTCDETPHRRVCNVVIATNLRERAVGEKGKA